MSVVSSMELNLVAKGLGMGKRWLLKGGEAWSFIIAELHR